MSITMPTVDRITAYEAGELDAHAVVDLFVDLINSGTIGHLQGSYQRAAHGLVSQGVIVRDANGHASVDTDVLDELIGG